MNTSCLDEIAGVVLLAVGDPSLELLNFLVGAEMVHPMQLARAKSEMSVSDCC